LYRLVEAIENMIADQQKSFEQACANNEVLTAPEYRGPKTEYLGKLPMQISFKGLQYIAKEHTKAQQAIPTGSNPQPRSLGPCGETCTTSWELGIPCCHTILKKRESNTPLTKRDVHQHWYIQESTSADPYRRILDPRITTSLRGRPRNTEQPPPAHLAISSGTASQFDRRRIGRPLGSGKSTGQRATGQRLQPSVRRRRSQWEITEEFRPISRRTRSQDQIVAVRSTTDTIRQRAPPRCGSCGDIGHRSTNKACPGRGLRVFSGLAADLAANAVNDEIAIAITIRIADVIAAPGLFSLSPSTSNLAFDDPRTIYQRYVDKRERWYQTQSSNMEKTDQAYRMAMGLPASYSSTSFRWCRNRRQMGKECTDSTGTRAWTEEEMMTYLDWDRAEDDRVDASLIVNPLDPATRGMDAIHARAHQDREEQQFLYS
jgi:hypothetical protein